MTARILATQSNERSLIDGTINGNTKVLGYNLSCPIQLIRFLGESCLCASRSQVESCTITASCIQLVEVSFLARKSDQSLFLLAHLLW